jgi:hypothetical protein
MNLYLERLLGIEQAYRGGNENRRVKPIHKYVGLEENQIDINFIPLRSRLDVEVEVENEKSVTFDLTPMAHNCGLVVLAGMEYTEYEHEYDNWEIPDEWDADFSFDFAIHLCKTMEYSQILYTICDEQGALATALKKKGFKLLKGSEVLNKRSNNHISMYVLNLN